MITQILYKILFTMSFPPNHKYSYHVSPLKLKSLTNNHLPNIKIIKTIDHLFEYSKYLDTYHLIQSSKVEQYT